VALSEALEVADAVMPADESAEALGPSVGVAVAGGEPQAATTINEASRAPIPERVRKCMSRILPGAASLPLRRSQVPIA